MKHRILAFSPESLRPRVVRSRRSRLVALALGLGLASFALADVSPRQPEIPNRKFNLADFGAVGDGKTVNTDAFARAVDAVNQAGGGTLVVPAGDYLTAQIRLCSNLRLQLEAGAHIKFSSNFSDYSAGPGRRKTLLLINEAHDVAVSGSGTLDGQGRPWWNVVKQQLAEASATHTPFREKGSRPWMLHAVHSQRVRVEGITLKDSPMFQCVFTGCEDVTVDGIKIFAPNKPGDHAYNTDGIDPIGSKRVLITHCLIDTGDDCVALKGSRNVGPVEDVLISDCTFLNGHGCSIGSGTGPAVRNVVVRNCTFDGTAAGIRLKSGRTRGGVVENLLYTDLQMKNVGTAITLYGYYPGRMPPLDKREIPEPVTDRTPVWRNITIRNVTAVNCTDGAGQVVGLPEMPAENITLENVSISAPTGLMFEQINGLTLRHVSVKAAKGDPIVISRGVSRLVRED